MILFGRFYLFLLDLYDVIYAPIAESPKNDIDEFYNKLQNQIDMIDKNDVLLIMGDWNAKVGTDHDTWCDNIGKYGFGNANERGERLLEFCCLNQLCITNTYFQHKASRKMDMGTSERAQQQHDRFHHC